jgi:exopolyphosphatase / guanosine-5'-triphosphate,3'-diphosphate pyrophosphatase
MSQSSTSSRIIFRGAVLDVGSNSVKFMLAEQRGGTLRIIQEKAYTTRLGASLALTGKLSLKSASETLEVLRRCRQEADDFGAEKLIAVGTSALRSAANKEIVLAPARTLLRTGIRIISGKVEGELVYAGATSSPRWREQTILVIDVGGGSVEFVLGRQGKVLKSISLPLGCVRIRDLFLQRQPPDPLGWQNASIHLETEIKKRIARYLPEKITCVGTGGTMITLAMVHRKHDASTWSSRINGASLSQKEMTLISKRFSQQSLTVLRKNPSIPKSRADIITTGSLIYSSAMMALNLNSIHCSTHGLRYGVWSKLLAPRPITRMIYPANR